MLQAGLRDFVPMTTSFVDGFGINWYIMYIMVRQEVICKPQVVPQRTVRFIISGQGYGERYKFQFIFSLALHVTDFLKPYTKQDSTNCPVPLASSTCL